MPANRKKRIERELDSTRKMIAYTSASVFAHKGYYGTKMEDVAEVCGYSPAAIYRYFKGKKELWAFLWNAMAQKLESIYGEAAKQDMPFIYQLKNLVNRMGSLLESDPHIIVIFISQRPYAALSAQTKLEKEAYDHYQAYQEQITNFMKKGIQEGVLRPGEPTDYTMLFVGLLYEFGFKWRRSTEPFDLDANRDKLIELFMRGAGAPQSE